MTYATQDDLVAQNTERKIILLSDPAGAAIQPDVVARALAGAEDEINGYLVTRYALPLTVVPQMLVNLECDIAVYKLASRTDGVVATDDMKTGYTMAIAKLKDIAAGRFAIPELTLPGGVVAGTGITQVGQSAPNPEFRDFMPMHRRRNPFGTY